MNDTALNEAVAFSLDNQLDHGKLLIALVEKSPAHFLELMERYGNAMELSVHLMKLDPATYLELAKRQAAEALQIGEIRECMRRNELITAIKLVRGGTGFGLKEAKDIIVAARNHLEAKGLISLPPILPGNPLVTTSPLNAPQQKVFNDIVLGF